MMTPERFREEPDAEPYFDPGDRRHDAPRDPPPMVTRPSSAMQLLAYRILTGPEEEQRAAAIALAEMVMKAAG